MTDRPSEDEKLDEFMSLLRRAYDAQDERMRRDFNRSLSFQDGMFDRFERAKRLGFGEGSSLFNSALVIGDVKVGAHSWVGPNVFLEGGYAPIRVGAYVSLSAGVQVYSHDTVAWSLSGGKSAKRVGPVTIGDRCYVGSLSVIACGLAVGDGAVIAAKSFVNENVAPGTIVGGAPAKVIGRVDFASGEPRLIFETAEKT
jgi:acetyltransferase-like isoleucine patch superfamily enzyme